jgi:hypothetical protein
MAQYGRPSIDTLNQSYTDQGGGSANLYTTVDEVSASDTDYIKSPLAPSNSVYVTKFSTVEDPQASTGHVVRYRYQKDAAGGAQINITIELRQGYTNESSQGTLIATVATLTNIANGWTTGSYTLSAGEADSITDYTALYLRIVTTQV